MTDLVEQISFFQYSKKGRFSLLNNKKIIGDYLKQKNAAPWFRGTSMYHLQGANMLLNALRDDAEQRTTHRIRSCLNLIGLEPMISSKDITCLMRLSRGNDLAFLWFLMEMHYKTPKPGKYSINEQLICTAICHLDAITTLRELDKILPCGHSSKRNSNSYKEKRNELKLKYNAKNKKPTPKYVLPYFEKMKLPVPYGKPLTLVIPGFKVRFENYKAYSDPNHVVHNESNRWYGNYNFNAKNRISFRIIHETIGNLFENFKSASLNAQTIDVLCDYHKTIKEMELNLERELKVTARDKCLKHYFGNGEEKEKRAQHIKELLDKAIEEQLCQFRKEANTLRKEMTLKTITSDCYIFDVKMGGEFSECCNTEPKNIDGCMQPNIKPKHSKEMPMLKENVSEMNNKVDENAQAAGDKYKAKDFSDQQPQCQIMEDWGDVFNNKRNEGEPTKKVEINMKSPVVHHVEKFGDTYMRNYDNRKEADTPTPSKTFFHRPKQHQPYKFDYRKIFTTKAKPDEMRQIKMAFLEALDKDISTLAELQNAELNLGVAATECANKTFDEAVKKYTIEHKDKIEEKVLEKNRPLSQYPQMGYYNCNNHELMDQMLADAFAHLRKNPKFVLAQLPESHKLAMLREWIARRYGKEYSPTERAKAYRLSCKIFRALDKIKFDFTMPNANQMGKYRITDYNSREYLVKKSKAIKDKYYHRLDTAYMEHTRIFWFATRAYICSNGPPRKIFYSYMPSRLRDIQHFRLWKSTEFRNYIGIWNDRQRAKRLEQFSG